MADNTASLVVALSAQLTKFEKDMRAAGIMADKAVNDIESKFSKMNPSISTSFFGNFFANLADKAIAGAIAAVGQLIDRFKELQKTAEYVDASMQWVFGLQEALRKSGASVEEVNAALKSVAFQLDEIKRGGDNALKTLFAAPGNQQFLKGFNAEAATAEETMKRVLTIIGEQGNMIRAIDVGKNIGVPASVAAAAFKEGADAIDEMAKKAAAAAPNIEAAANASAKLSAAWSAFTKEIGSGWAEIALAGFQKIAAVALAITEMEQSWFKGGPLEAASTRELARWQEINRILNDTKKTTDGLTRVKVSGGTAEDPFARKATGTDQASAFDRANDQVTKHIALMNADAAAVGLDAGAHEALRTQALLKTAAEKDGIAITDQMNQKINEQADAAGRAALALAVAQERMSKLNSASQQIGSALSTAFADAIVDGKKLNDVISSLIKTLEKAAINATIMSFFTPSAGQGTSSFLSWLGLGKRMAGGPVNAGSPYLVGEHGPELMVPGQSGMVVPNSAIGRGASGQTFAPVYQINAAGADSGTVERIRTVLAAHSKAIASQANAMVSAQRYQSSGVA